MVNKNILQDGFRNRLPDTRKIKCGSWLVESSHRRDSRRYLHNSPFAIDSSLTGSCIDTYAARVCLVDPAQPMPGSPPPSHPPTP
jgi:hypothetical protein